MGETRQETAVDREAGRILAPWSQATVDGLNAWQQAGHVHPFTHECGTVLRATKGGWVCPDIGCSTYDDPNADYPSVVQRWAHSYMAGGPPPDTFAELMAELASRPAPPSETARDGGET